MDEGMQRNYNNYRTYCLEYKSLNWQEVGNKVQAYFYVTAFRQCVLRHDYNYRIYKKDHYMSVPKIHLRSNALKCKQGRQPKMRVLIYEDVHLDNILYCILR